MAMDTFIIDSCWLDNFQEEYGSTFNIIALHKKQNVTMMFLKENESMVTKFLLIGNSSSNI